MGLSHISLFVFLSSFWIRVIVLLMFFSSISSAIGNETDQLALIQFKDKITDDPLGVLNSWNDTIHFCQWYGVTCGHRHQRVTMFVLNSIKLAGSISPHIGNLSFLRVLDLKNNSFSLDIGDVVAKLHFVREQCLRTRSHGRRLYAQTVQTAGTQRGGLV